ncbi:MAG: TetR/AcrR family transcriptional regulator [bacterium]
MRSYSPEGELTPTANGCPQRGKHDKEGRREAFISAAAKVFAAHGFDAATTRQVADAAGCSEGLIHRYFGSKRGLLLALLDARATEVAESFAPPSTDGVQSAVRAILLNQVETMWVRRDVMRVNVSQASIDPEVGEVVSRRFHEVRVAQIFELLRPLQLGSEIRPDADLQSVAYSLSGLGFALGFWAQVAFGHDRERVRQTAAEFADIVARGLLPDQPAGLAPNGHGESS